MISQREPLYRRLVLAIGIALLIGWAARGLIRADDGDFKVHWETGRRFLAGEFLYAGGHDFPYPPLLGLIFAPAALMPMPIGKAIFYPVGIAALLLLLWLMHNLIRSTFRLTEKQAFWASAFAAFLCVQFILRDQAELGLNTAIAALIWLSIYLWRQGRNVAAGTSLGLATAIKCTPAIFMAYFIWKRQWQMAFWSAAAALFFTVLPMVRQGSGSWSRHMTTWAATAIQGVSGTGAASGAIQSSPINNMALRPALMRYLTGAPQASDSLPDSRQVAFLNLARGAAQWIVNAIFIGIIGLFLWWSRSAVVDPKQSRLLWELAATGMLMLLLSPITWSQHCVALLPACVLIGALVAVRDRTPGWVIGVVSVYIVFCALLARDLIGRTLAVQLNAYHVSTFCIVGLFAVALAGPRLEHPP